MCNEVAILRFAIALQKLDKAPEARACQYGVDWAGRWADGKQDFLYLCVTHALELGLVDNHQALLFAMDSQ